MSGPLKVTDLPSASALGGTEVVPGVQGTSGTFGGTVKILISQIGTYVRGLFTTTPVTIAEGGTNAATATGARTNLSAAESGANTDITSLNAPALGSATATTQSAGDSSTKVATTAFVSTSVTASHNIWGGIPNIDFGGDSSNDFNISAGGCMNSTGSYWMILPNYVKRSDATFTAGNNGGMLDTGAVSNVQYFLWAIGDVTNNLVDYISSTSAANPTMPSGYTVKRLIGWFFRTGGATRVYNAYETAGGGIRYDYQTPPLIIDSSSLTTARLNCSLSGAIPVASETNTISRIMVDIRVYGNDAGGANIVIQQGSETDAAPSVSATPGVSMILAAGVPQATTLRIRASAGSIFARASAAVDTFRIWVVGFDFSRSPT